MRGIAAIMVMLYHADVIFGISTPFSRGYLFVDFFFLLSGFVLTLGGERKLERGRGAAEFLWVRVKRLWPLTTVGAVVGACAALFMGGHDGIAISVALALLMIPAVRGAGQLFPLNGPQWSLFLELTANVLHAFVLSRMDDRQLRATILVAALGLAASIMVFGSNTTGPFAYNWQWALPRVAFSYILGVWFARRWMTGRRTLIISWKYAIVLPAIGVITLPCLPMPLGIGDLLMTVVVLPALFWMAALAPVPTQAEAWLGRIGSLSFPLYAVHLPIMDAVASVSRSVPSMLLAIIVAIFGAWLITLAQSALSMRDQEMRRPICPVAHVS